MFTQLRYKKDGPLYRQTQKPPILLVPYNDFGLKKLKQRTSKTKIIRKY